MKLTQFAILVLLISALGLTACGRRGDLEPPPGSEDRELEDEFVLDPLL